MGVIASLKFWVFWSLLFVRRTFMIGGFFALMTCQAPYDWVALLMRLAIGLTLLPHGLNKIRHRHAYSNFPKVPFFSQKSAFYSAMIIETGGSILIILGFWMRLALIPVIICMAVATSTDKQGYWLSPALVFLLGAIALFVAGSGMYSLDGLFLTTVPHQAP